MNVDTVCSMNNRKVYESPEIEKVKLDNNMSLMLQSVDEYPDFGPGEAYFSSDNPVINKHDMFV